jgi:hypothetical protein
MRFRSEFRRTSSEEKYRLRLNSEQRLGMVRKRFWSDPEMEPAMAYHFFVLTRHARRRVYLNIEGCRILG